MAEEKILVAYASKRGSARQAAQWIAAELGDDCDLVDLKASPGIDIEAYGTVVLGSGIMAGSAYPPLERFIKRNREKLVFKDLCLFITHLEKGEGIEKDFQSAFDEGLLKRARVRMGVGGRLILSQLNFLYRMIFRRISKNKGVDLDNYDSLSREACAEFAGKVLAGAGEETGETVH